MLGRDLNFSAGWFINYTSEEVHRFNLTLLYPLNHCMPPAPGLVTNQRTLTHETDHSQDEQIVAAVAEVAGGGWGGLLDCFITLDWDGILTLD